MAQGGGRAVMVYLSQIGSTSTIALARDLDPADGRAFDLARAAGVEALGLVCAIERQGITVARAAPMLG